MMDNIGQVAKEIVATRTRLDDVCHELLKARDVGACVERIRIKYDPQTRSYVFAIKYERKSNEVRTRRDRKS